MAEKTEWSGRDYNPVSEMQRTIALDALTRIALRGTERVLDVGCGDGKITAHLAASVPEGSALGVDRSGAMVAFASEHFGPDSHPNLRFEMADAGNLPHRDEFDLVVSFHALHWVLDPASAFRSFRAALKTEGRVLLICLVSGERPSVLDDIDATRRSSRWSGYFPGFRKPYAHFRAGQYCAMAERAGLEVARVEETEIAWDFETRAAFVEFSRATFVYWTRLLPASERDSFIIDVLDRYRAAAPESPEDNVFRFRQMEALFTAGGRAEPNGVVAR